MSNITIYEIAQEAGCSAATVSRVINGYPYIKKATRERVERIIEERNFMPSDTARNLVKQSTRMIGILISDLRTTQHTDGIYYIERELSKEGYSCIICNTGEGEEAVTSYLQILSKRNVDALILMGSIYQNDEVEKAVNQYMANVPVVFCNGSINGDNIYSIVSDEDRGVYNAVKLLKDTGCVNPVFIYDRKTASNMKKMDGFMRGVEECGFGTEGRILETTQDAGGIYETVKAFLSDNMGVDSIIFSEDFLAVASMRVFSEMGKKIPQDISIIGINNSRFALVAVPPITSLDNKLYDMSITAVRTILSLLKGEPVAKKLLLISDIVERGTTRKR